MCKWLLLQNVNIILTSIYDQDFTRNLKNLTNRAPVKNRNFRQIENMTQVLKIKRKIVFFPKINFFFCKIFKLSLVILDIPRY